MTGKKLAKYWLHCDFITIDGQKISKSLGNTYTLDDLADKGFSAMDYKMWLLSGHYQGTRNFTFDSLLAAKNRRQNWRNRIAECYQREMDGDDDVFEKILDAVNNNLNSAEAFAIIDNSRLSLNDWEKVDELFGLRLIVDTPKISEKQYALVKERDAARAAKDFAKSDKIRDELLSQGIVINDTPNGGVWQYSV